MDQHCGITDVERKDMSMKKTHVKTLLRIATLLSVAVIGGNVAQAQSCNVEWTNKAGDGLWSTAGNWSTNQVPGPTSDVCIQTTTG
jgi:hypothetical protein